MMIMMIMSYMASTLHDHQADYDDENDDHDKGTWQENMLQSKNNPPPSLMIKLIMMIIMRIMIMTYILKTKILAVPFSQPKKIGGKSV